MNHLHLFPLFLLMVFTSHIYAQQEYPTDYKIEYELTFVQDTTDLEHKDTEKMYLFSGSRYGVFVNKPRAEAEERMEEIMKRFGGSVQVKLGVNTNKGQDLNKAIFTDFQQGEILVLQELADKDYIYEEKNHAEWKITEEMEEYMDYAVQKATTEFGGRTYEAWFTMEVPIPDGPYIFNGLPGLIVELYDTQKHYHFKMKSIDKLEEPKVWVLPKAKLSSKEKVLQTAQKLNQNALNSSDYGYMMSRTPGISGSSSNTNGQINLDIQDKSGKKISKEDLKRMYKAQLEKQNNPIELE